MKTCPNCGHENNETDRFCANCGARLTPVAKVQQAPAEPAPTGSTEPVESETPAPKSEPAIPPSVTPSFAQNRGEQQSWERNREPVDDEWKMSSLGPPPAQRRPIWLWLIVGFFLLILLCCILGFVFFNYTDTGQQVWDDAMATATSMAQDAGDATPVD